MDTKLLPVLNVRTEAGAVLVDTPLQELRPRVPRQRVAVPVECLVFVVGFDDVGGRPLRWRRGAR
eukprot:6109733-Prymnesium_polylepis.2